MQSTDLKAAPTGSSKPGEKATNGGTGSSGGSSAGSSASPWFALTFGLGVLLVGVMIA